MRIALALLLLLTPVRVAAAEPALSRTYEACMDRAGGVTVSMRECMSAEHERQDARLNANYRELSRLLSHERRALLVQAQRAWLTWRKAECEHRASEAMDGTLGPVMIDDCWLTMTAERADAFANELKRVGEYGGD